MERVLRMRSCTRILMVALLLAPTASHATENWISQNALFAVDTAARGTSNISNGDSVSRYLLGLDYRKVFTGAHGDIGTFIAQPYWVKASNANTTALTWRITNFNYTALSRGQFNVRLGHFELPFGLEQNIDTNGTLRQYSFGERGLKVDWGATVNGILPNFEYEVAWSRGSGNEYLDRNGVSLWSGRVGSSQSNNTVVGASFLDGTILTNAGKGTRTLTRYGFDIAHYYRQWEILFETSTGRNERDSTHAYLAELSWRSPAETLHSYLQLDKRTNGLNESQSTRLGAQWFVSRMLDLETQVALTRNTNGDLEDDSVFTLQLRYRMQL